MAINHVGAFGSKNVSVLRVKADSGDLISGGYFGPIESAAFTKVSIHRKEYKRAYKKMQEINAAMKNDTIALIEIKEE